MGDVPGQVSRRSERLVSESGQRNGGTSAGGETAPEPACGEALSSRSTATELLAAARAITAAAAVDDLIAIVPELALRVCPAPAAALLRVLADGPVETLASRGSFHAPQAWIEEEARTANGEACSAAASHRPRGLASRGKYCLAVVPLEVRAEGLVLALERQAADGGIGEADRERLALLASLAGTAIAHARAEVVVARDDAALAAIRDGVLALDRDGVVNAVNPAAAATLGVRRHDLVGKRLRDVAALAPLAQVLERSPSNDMEVVSLPNGEIVLRSEPYPWGVIATIRDVVAEQGIAHRITGSGARYTFEHVVGASPALLRVVEDARRAARSDIPVLLYGESGTGKEVLAQAIHSASPHPSAPFIGINMTAIPRELLESELFGYDGGSFTGARASGRAGKFELAGCGTLLLDEIGDMPLELQSKLLRVLQERLVQRIGSARDIRVRARIIATTQHDLDALVKAGRFRLDLYHRLRVVHLRLPLLRERKEDIPLLVDHALQAHARKRRRQQPVRVAPHVLDALLAYDWPGNVRELLNVLEGELSVLAPDARELTRIPSALLEAAMHGPAVIEASPAVLTLEEMERRACVESLAKFHGNVARAAKALGVAKGTLYNKLKRYGLASSEPPYSGQPEAPRREGPSS
ncbi:MAG TPA: sigma 54-interacting transcriptional regulator [Anaeromyxobacter sp.]|nr:sigma 54-interacting transcriptional regulator [Anaeromyxobacter sp.]